MLSEQQGLQKRCSSVAKTFCTLHFSANKETNTTLHKSKNWMQCKYVFKKNQLISRNFNNKYDRQMMNTRKIFLYLFNFLIRSFVISLLSETTELFTRPWIINRKCVYGAGIQQKEWSKVRWYNMHGNSNKSICRYLMDQPDYGNCFPPKYDQYFQNIDRVYVMICI